MEWTGIDQLPWLKTYPAIAANALLFFYAVINRPKLRGYLIFFSLATLVDILVASKILAMPTESAQVTAEYVFVLIGDLRYILILAFLVYAGAPLSDLHRLRLSGAVLRPALIFTLFPTLIVSAIGFAKPDLLSVSRHKFLAYEITFFILTVLWTYIVLPQKPIKSVERNFARRAAFPVLLFYGLWTLSDILILKGITFGHALRVIPNLLYYCGFLWWINLGDQSADT
jgi:hypothetical protein